MQEWSEELCDEIEALGLKILARPTCRAPHVTTIMLPENISSMALGNKMAEAGILVSYRSEYLLRGNQIQVCFMGQCQRPPRELIYYLQQAVECNK